MKQTKKPSKVTDTAHMRMHPAYPFWSFCQPSGLGRYANRTILDWRRVDCKLCLKRRAAIQQQRGKK